MHQRDIEILIIRAAKALHCAKEAEKQSQEECFPMEMGGDKMKAYRRLHAARAVVFNMEFVFQGRAVHGDIIKEARNSALAWLEAKWETGYAESMAQASAEESPDNAASPEVAAALNAAISAEQLAKTRALRAWAAAHEEP